VESPVPGFFEADVPEIRSELLHAPVALDPVPPMKRPLYIPPPNFFVQGAGGFELHLPLVQRDSHILVDAVLFSTLTGFLLYIDKGRVPLVLYPNFPLFASEQAELHPLLLLSSEMKPASNSEGASISVI
jgi:hypothetical protein